MLYNATLFFIRVKLHSKAFFFLSYLVSIHENIPTQWHIHTCISQLFPIIITEETAASDVITKNTPPVVLFTLECRFLFKFVWSLSHEFRRFLLLLLLFLLVTLPPPDKLRTFMIVVVAIGACNNVVVMPLNKPTLCLDDNLSINNDMISYFLLLQNPIYLLLRLILITRN